MEQVSKSQDFLNKIKQKLNDDKKVAVASEKTKILKENITKAKTQDEIAKAFGSQDLKLVVGCLKSLIEQNYTKGQDCNMIFNLDVILKEDKDSSNTVLVAISELLKESQFSSFNQQLNHANFYKHTKNFMLKGFKTRTQIQDFSRSYLDTKNPKDAFIVLDYLIKGCKKDESDVNYAVISPMEYIILKCRYAGLAMMFADMSKSKVLSKPQTQTNTNQKQSSLSNEHQKILYDYKKGYESGQKDLMLNAVSELMKSDNPQELIEALADMDVDTLIEALNSDAFSPEAVAGLFAILPADVIANIFSKVENDKKKLAALFALLNKVYKGDNSPNKQASLSAPIAKRSAAAGAHASVAADALFYEQLAPAVLRALPALLAGGGLGAGGASLASLVSLSPGVAPAANSHFLLRYEKFLLWMCVHEVGARYAVVSLKGLELQGTSCHAVEASSVDAVFDAALQPDAVAASSASALVPAAHLAHTLAPLSTVQVAGYSVARYR